MNWTTDQRQVIGARSENLLVSAAAGSGKTAVLVARLLGRILDPNEKANIDDFLVVTFTRAAAAEMKERVSRRILEELENQPENEHLRRQLTLVNRAKIMTIHGFCSWVASSYASLIGIDMAFRVANSGEKKLMEADVIAQVMEDAHAEAAREAEAGSQAEAGDAGTEVPDPDGGSFSEKFRAFLETFAAGKNEKDLEKLITKVYETAMSGPYPEDYYALCRRSAAVSTIEEMSAQPWMTAYWLDIDDTIGEALALVRECETLMAREGAPAAYAKTAAAYAGLFRGLKELGHSYGELFEAVRSAEIPKLGRGKGKTEDPALREQTKKVIDRIAGAYKHLKTGAFPYAPELALSTVRSAAGPVDMLVTMAERYGKALEAAKRRKNVLDFSDLEHMALKVLRDENRQRTPAAIEIARSFREVMIDEYQDSNYLQEAILTAVSTIEDGVDNYFCVGDVKQSIYSFRQARPDLFMEKFHGYESRNGTEAERVGSPADRAGTGAETADPTALRGRRIDLHQNFRSRPEILEGVNAVFRRIMREEIGGITYDNDAALMAGTEKERLLLLDGEEVSHAVDVLAVMTDEEDEDGLQVLDEKGKDAKIALEARAVAGRIKDLTANHRIGDENGNTRPVEYRDIVILLRTVDGVAEGFKKGLEAEDIPVVVQEKKGFFESPEVRILLSFLQVLDNPRQDIPLAAAMRSVIGGFSSEELAQIRGNRFVSGIPSGNAAAAQQETLPEDGQPPAVTQTDFYDYVTAFSRAGADAGLREKCGAFLALIQTYQRQATHTPIHELMTEIVRETGLGDYAAALPNGLQRSANLRMLIESAVAYEQTSYVGLFNFVRYIGSLEEQKEEMEAASLGESENAVRIVSIHKSKGLEYPVVFVCQLGAQLNMRELSNSVLIDPRLGIASNYVDYERRITYPTIMKEAFKRKAVIETIGEELRVLYVALTRAKLKLYLVGTAKDEESLEFKYRLRPERETGFLPAGYLAKAKTRWDLLMPAILDEIGNAGGETTELSADEVPCGPGSSASLRLIVIPPTELIADENEAAAAQSGHLRQIRNYDPETVLDPVVRAGLDERFGYVYPFEDRKDIPAKVSVSEIKMAHMEMGDESGLTPFEEADVVPLIPAFMQDMAEQQPAEGPSVALTGAAVGTAYHSLLYRLDLSDPDVNTTEGVRRQIAACVDNGYLAEAPAAALSPHRIARFAGSEIGLRMAAADRQGKLKREQPFTMRVPASAVRGGWPDDEFVLIQGIIDVCFEEDGKLYLLDYKTDRVAAPEELIDRYRVQLDFYARALKTATGKTVAGKYLYSFGLGKLVKV